MDIIAQLRKLNKELNKRFTDINNGGCAKYASMVIETLKEHGIEAYAQVCAPSYNKEYGNSVDYVRNNSRPDSLQTGDDWYQMGVRFYHVIVVIIVDGVRYFYDSEHLQKNRPSFKKYYVMPGHITPEEIQSIAYDGTMDWNDMFDTSQLSDICLTVKEFLSVQ